MYTTKQNVEAYFKKLGQEVTFDQNSKPSQNDVENWIEEESSWIDEQTQYRYSSETREDILHYTGQDYLLTSFSPIEGVELYVNRASEYEEPDWERLNEYKDYSVEKSKGRIILTNKNIFVLRTFHPTRSQSYKHENNKFKVVYTSGEQSPKWLQGIATRRVVYRVLQSSINMNINEGVSSLSAGAVTVVTPSDMGTNALKQLKTDIKEDEERLTKSTGAYRYVNYLIN